MRVVNPPHRIGLEKYEESLEAYVSRARSVSAVRAIATMGTVKAPGLSDLDVLVVLPDDYDGSDAAKLDIEGLDRGIFLHGPMVLSESQAQSIQHLIFASDLHMVWGDARFERFDELPAESRAALALAYVIDFTEARLCRFSRVTDELDMRGWMTRLWSFVHTQSLCEIAGVEVGPESRDVIQRIRALRTSWVAGGAIDEVEFVDLFRLASGVAVEVLETALQELEKHLGHPAENASMGRRLRRNKRIVFETSRTKVEVAGRRVHVGSRSRLYETTWAPSRYALQLALYGLIPASGWRFDSDHPVVATARKRAATVRAHDTYLERLGISFSLRGNLGLNAKREFIPGWVDRLVWMGLEMSEGRG